MVKPGYMHTEVGVVPEAWEISSLAVAFPKLEAGVSVNSDNTLSSEYHILKTSAVHDGVVSLSETKPVVPQDYHRVKCPLSKGSMVISRMNTPALVGECGFVKEATKGVYLPDRLWQIKNPPGSKFDFEWLNYLLNTKQYRDAIRATATGTSNSMKNISKERLLEIKIPRPSLDEQRHIAAVLADLDNLIHLEEKQIVKKKAIKQGAMQELLTGKRRLPGFSGKWRTENIPNVLQKQEGIKIGPFGSQLKKEYLLEYGSYRVYGQENVYAQDFSIGNRYLSCERFKQLQSCEIQSGDFLISTMGTIGKCTIVPSGIQSGIMDSHLIRLRINEQKLIPEYLFYLFSEELGYLKEQTSKLSVGGIMDGLSTKIVNALSVFYPEDMSEQKSIAEFLSTMNAEIQTLEQKLEKYRQVKQGMMQQLLTGKIRLV